MRGGYYRPMYFHTLEGGHRCATARSSAGSIASSASRSSRARPLDNGAPIDLTSVEGAANLPYDIPNLQVELHTTKIGVPIQWWRSVGSTHTAYSTECFIDDIARATKQDPVELRRCCCCRSTRATSPC